MSKKDVEQQPRKRGRKRIHPDTKEAKREADRRNQERRRQRDEETGYKELRGLRGYENEREMVANLTAALGYNTMRDMVFSELKKIADAAGVSCVSPSVREKYTRLKADYHYIKERYGLPAIDADAELAKMLEDPLHTTANDIMRARLLSFFDSDHYTGSNDHVLDEIASRYMEEAGEQ